MLVFYVSQVRRNEVRSNGILSWNVSFYVSQIRRNEVRSNEILNWNSSFTYDRVLQKRGTVQWDHKLTIAEENFSPVDWQLIHIFSNESVSRFQVFSKTVNAWKKFLKVRNVFGRQSGQSNVQRRRLPDRCLFDYIKSIIQCR